MLNDELFQNYLSFKISCLLDSGAIAAIFGKRRFQICGQELQHELHDQFNL